MNLENINWADDGITRKWVSGHRAALEFLESVNPKLLAEAATYCTDFMNPFTLELIKRAGKTWQFDRAANEAAQVKIIKEAARSFDIIII